MNKICRYHLLRSEGLRLYARKSWAYLLPNAGASFHTTYQVSSKRDNPMFTGDSDMSWLDKLKDSFKFQGKLRYPHQCHDMSWLDKLKDSFKFQGKLRYPHQLLHVNGTRLYICCEQAVEYNNLMTASGLPQTFFTWYKLTTLHVWLLMTRLITEGREGRHVRNRVVASLQEDLKSRSKQFAKVEGFSLSSDQYNDYNEIFLGAIINYDEGLLGDDKALAGAIWRILYGYQEVDAENLELFIHYIRKQAHHLQLQRTVDILGSGWVTFLPLHSEKIDKVKLAELQEHLTSKLGGLKVPLVGQS